MKTKHLLPAVLLLSQALTSCDYINGFLSDGSVANAVEYLPVQTEAGASWSMVSPDGKLLFTEEFRERPSAVVNGYFTVEEGRGYTVYKASDKPKPVKGCDDLYSAGAMAYGLMPVAQRGSRITLIDGKGKTRATLTPIGSAEITTCAPYFCDGMLIITSDYHKGAVDTDGKVVVKPRYEHLTSFSGGYAMGYREISGSMRYVIVDKKGDEVAKVSNGISVADGPFVNDRIPARDNDDRWGFVSTKGEFKRVSRKVRAIGEYNGDGFIFMDENYKWGLMDYDSEVMIRPRYDAITLTVDGHYLAVNSDNVSILDKKGEKLTSFSDYDNLYIVGKRFPLIAREGSYYILLDRKGKPAGKAEFHAIGNDITLTSQVYSDYHPTSASASDDYTTVAEESSEPLLIESTAPVDGSAQETLRLQASSFVHEGQDELLFNGYFSDSKKQYPITLTFRKNDFSTCMYHNVDYNVSLKMNVRFAAEQMILSGMAGSDPFSITLTPSGEGAWSGYAIVGSTHLDAYVFNEQ